MDDLNSGDFLQLMIAELQSRIRSIPMDNSELVQQIGAIRELSATTKLTSTLDTVLMGQNLSTASGLIGKKVDALDDQGNTVQGSCRSSHRNHRSERRQQTRSPRSRWREGNTAQERPRNTVVGRVPTRPDGSGDPSYFKHFSFTEFHKMGLASALTTALTGLSAAEVQIDVVGNNLANSQTVGFKASEAVFVTQFLQTQSLGSAPSGTDGGTNPRQIGLGVRVGEISPDFTQGTIEVSSSPSDLAIQGEGFFVVQGNQGQDLYTRNGIFKTNSENKLVTTTGNLVLGYGIDEDYVIRATDTLVPLEIPLGQRFVAKATENVRIEGTLTPTGDIADTAQVIDSVVLGDGSYTRPPTGTTTDGRPPGRQQPYRQLQLSGDLVQLRDATRKPAQ